MPTILDTYPETYNNSDESIQAVHPSGTTAPSAQGQCFLTPLISSYKLTSVKFYMRKIGSPIGILKARLYLMTGTYGSSGKPTGSPLASSDAVAMENIPTSNTLIEFIFSGNQQYSLSKSTMYSIDVEAESATTLNTSNYINLRYYGLSKHDGNRFSYASNTWTAYSPDMNFYVYGEEITPSIESSTIDSGFLFQPRPYGSHTSIYDDINGIVYVFYIDGTNNDIKYKYSIDGLGWVSGGIIDEDAKGDDGWSNCAVDYDGTQLTLIWISKANGRNLRFRQGTISGGAISWIGSVGTISAEQYYAICGIDVAYESTGYIHVGFHSYSSGYTEWRLYRSTTAYGSTFTLKRRYQQSAANSSRGNMTLCKRPDGKMFALLGRSIGLKHWVTFDGSNWLGTDGYPPPNGITSSTWNLHDEMFNVCAISDPNSDNCYFIIPYYDTTSIDLYKFTGSTQSIAFLTIIHNDCVKDVGPTNVRVAMGLKMNGSAVIIDIFYKKHTLPVNIFRKEFTISTGTLGSQIVYHSETNIDNPNMSQYVNGYVTNKNFLVISINDNTVRFVFEDGVFPPSKIFLTVNSSPTASGFRFELTKEGESPVEHYTPWSGNIYKEVNYTIEFDDPQDVGGDHYRFDKWEDNSTDNPRNLYLSEDTTLIAYFIFQYKVTIQSDPNNVQFDIGYNGGTKTSQITPYITPYTDKNTIVNIEMPQSYTFGSILKWFWKWENGNKNRFRDIDLISNMIITSYYLQDFGEPAHILTKRINKPLSNIEIKYGGESYIIEHDGYLVAQPDNNPYRIRWFGKTLYAANLFWVFYIILTTGYYLAYKTSSDGINWSNETVLSQPVQYQYGETAGVIFDGTYFHFALKYGGTIYYRRGLPNTNGTITWSTPSWQEAFTTTDLVKTDHHLCLDSEGYPYIVWHHGIIITSVYPYITKSSRNDGVWQTASGYPYQLMGIKYSSMIAQLPNQDMLVIMVDANGVDRFTYQKWNNSTQQWESWKYASENAPYSQNPVDGHGETWSWDLVVDGEGNIYFVFLDVNLNIRFRKYTYSTDSWGTELTIITASTHASPQLIIDKVLKRVITFWCGTPTEHHIYYKSYRYNINIWEETVDWLNESTDQLVWGVDGNDGVLSSFYEKLGDYMGLAYMTKTQGSTPYKTKFAYLELTKYYHPVDIDIERA